MTKNTGRSLSVKCSIYTKPLLEELFKKDQVFNNFEKNGVVLNPSWFFKFSANFTLKNLNLIFDMEDDFPYNSHYVDFFDTALKNRIKSNYFLGSL